MLYPMLHSLSGRESILSEEREYSLSERVFRLGENNNTSASLCLDILKSYENLIHLYIMMTLIDMNCCNMSLYEIENICEKFNCKRHLSLLN
jgi:hypothetical protein